MTTEFRSGGNTYSVKETVFDFGSHGHSLPVTTDQGRRMSFTIGIDVGGTFTDIVVAGPDGKTIIAKAATTPADQSDGVLEGIALAAQQLGLTPAALLARNISDRARHDGRHQRVVGGQDRAGRIADHRGPSRRHRNARGPEAGTLQPAHGAAGAAGAAAACGCRCGNGCGPTDRWRSRWTRPRSIAPSLAWPRQMCARWRSASCTRGATRSTNSRPPRPSGRGCRMRM